MHKNASLAAQTEGPMRDEEIHSRRRVREKLVNMASVWKRQKFKYKKDKYKKGQLQKKAEYIKG